MKNLGVQLLLIVSVESLAVDSQNDFINFADIPCGIQHHQHNHPAAQLYPNQQQIPSVLFRSGKIIPGDEPSAPGEFPWIVSFRWNNNGEHFCAGSIISKNYILSAAHCFTKFTNQSSTTAHSQPYPYKWMEVAIGEINLGRIAQMNKHFSVEEVWVHPWFNQSNYSNDIAIVKLAEDIVWTPLRQPVCLPQALTKGNVETEYEIYKNSGNKITIAGWGSTKMGPGPTNVLKKASIDSIYKTDECQSAYANLGSREKVEIVEEHLCAGGRSKYKHNSNKIMENNHNNHGDADACYGDSGGPLMMSLSSLRLGKTPATNHLNITVAIGIISAGGKGCARYPGIYARISKYIDWIKMLVPPPQVLDSGQVPTDGDNSVVVNMHLL